MINLVTGKRGVAHVTSADDAALTQGIIGVDGVFTTGNAMGYEIISANEIRILDGDAVLQGREFRIDPGTYETANIETGMVGYKRIDLICSRYSVDADNGNESMEIVVIQGTDSTGTPATPSYNTGSIRSGATVVDMPLYKVEIDGITISRVRNMFQTIKGFGSGNTVYTFNYSTDTNLTNGKYQANGSNWQNVTYNQVYVTVDPGIYQIKLGMIVRGTENGMMTIKWNDDDIVGTHKTKASVPIFAAKQSTVKSEFLIKVTERSAITGYPQINNSAALDLRAAWCEIVKVGGTLVTLT